MSANFDELRQLLEEEKERLIREIEQITADASSSRVSSESSPFGKREEEATVTFELEKRLALEKNLKNQLSEVEHALDKFEAGTYGLCDRCGEPIGLERLQALPRANLCLRCKKDDQSKSTTR